MTKNDLLLALLMLLFPLNTFSQGNVPTTLSEETQTIFDADAATQVYLNSLTKEQRASSDAYFEGGYWLLLWNMLYDVVVALVFLQLGLSRKIKQMASRFSNIHLQTIIYFWAYLLLAYILAFPIHFYEDFFREHQYALSNQTFSEWMGDEVVMILLLAVIGGLFTAVLYAVIRKVKHQWWAWAGGVSMVFLVVIMYIGPVFIAPLFNEYNPLEQGTLKNEILSMARANAVPADNVYQFDASRQSSRISANVSGIGSTIRISLNDNLLNRCSPQEVKAVMGHELGHYVLNHVYKSLIYFGLVILFAFAFIHWAFQKLIVRWGEKWSVQDISDIAGLPLIMVLFSFYFFTATPITNSIIRVSELEADIYGLNASREPDGFASVAMKLSEYRKIEPGYWEEVLFFDHPSGRTRVSTSMKWKAENLPSQNLHPMRIQLDQDKQQNGEGPE